MLRYYDQTFSHLFSPYFDQIPEFERRKFIASSWPKKWMRAVYAVWTAVKSALKKQTYTPATGKWVMVDAINNFDTVSFLSRSDSEIEFLTFGNDARLLPKGVKKVLLPSRLRSVPSMVNYLWRNRKKIGSRWDYFFVHFGIVEAAFRFVVLKKPEAVLFTNDHTPLNRALMLACRHFSVTTGYLQHACVREDFGKLLVDHAFLEGQDSFDKYKLHSIDESTKVHWVGMPKFKDLERQQPKAIRTIGLAFNTTDRIDWVKDFVDKVNQRTEFKIIVRPHPKDNRQFPFLSQVESSNPSTENPIDYLRRVDALIAGDSSIHIEAVMLNKPSYYFKFNDSQIFDLYGFAKNGLVKFYDDFDTWVKDTEAWNRSPKDIYQNAGYYNSDLINLDHDKKGGEAVYRVLFDSTSMVGDITLAKRSAQEP